MRATRLHAVILVSAGLLLTAGSSGAAAQQPQGNAEAHAREWIRQAQEALRRVQADNSRLTEENAKLNGQLRHTEEELRAVRREAAAARGRSASEQQDARSAQANLSDRLADARQRLAQIAEHEHQLESALAVSGTERQAMQRQLEQSRESTTGCERQNLQLYEYAAEALQLYERKGVFAALAQKEPVLGLKDVAIQNTVEAYRHKLAAQRVRPGAGTSP